jgi:hypothetical protein
MNAWRGHGSGRQANAPQPPRQQISLLNRSVTCIKQDITATWPLTFLSSLQRLLPVEMFEHFNGSIFHVTLSEIRNSALFKNSSDPEVSKKK